MIFRLIAMQLTRTVKTKRFVKNESDGPDVGCENESDGPEEASENDSDDQENDEVDVDYEHLQVDEGHDSDEQNDDHKSDDGDDDDDSDDDENAEEDDNENDQRNSHRPGRLSSLLREYLKNGGCCSSNCLIKYKDLATKRAYAMSQLRKATKKAVILGMLAMIHVLSLNLFPVVNVLEDLSTIDLTGLLGFAIQHSVL